MSEEKFFSNYGKNPKFVDRYNSGELKVEKAGYQPAFKEIAQMIASGERFQKAREFQYKNEAEIDEKVNHVDTYDKDVFEMIDESRRLEAGVIADIQASEKAKKEAEKQAIIDDYEKSKADKAEAPTSEAQ